MDLSVLADPDRLRALRSTSLMDSLPEPAYDRFVRLAAKIAGTPTALLSLVDDHRQFFKAQIGLGEPWAALRQTPLTHSFCQYVVASGEPLVVRSAREHPLVKDNLAIPDIGVEAYLGAPLRLDGQALGSLCVIDGKPRDWSDEDREALADLAAMVATEMDLRRREEELRAERDFAQALADAIPAIVYLEDFEIDRIVYLNGFGRDVLSLGEGWTLADVLHPDDRKLLVERQRRLARGVPSDQIESRWFHPGGKYRWVTDRMTVLSRAPDGTPLRGLGVASDLDEVKQNEAGLLASQRTLRQFLARASHELRTPLQGILSSTEMALHDNASSEPTRHLMESAQTSTKAMLALVDDLLEMHRLGEGEHKPVLSEFGLPERLGWLKMEFSDSDRELTFEVSDDIDPIIISDWTKIRLILSHLIRNALRYTHGSVAVRASRSGDRLLLDVEDQGAGMSPEELAHIFEPFGRLQEGGGGTGLGLSLARGLAEALEGTLTATSEAGEGSTFHVNLPYRGGVDESHSSLPPRRRVLVVDDHELNLELFEVMLQSLGQDVSLATSGAEALTTLETASFDLVLMDLQMPGLSGFETLAKIVPSDSMKVVAMSAGAVAETKRRCREAGFYAVLSKPVSRQELCRFLAEDRSFSES